MKIVNKNASSFKALETLEAGIVLSGSEVKAIRLGHADLASSYVKIINDEAHLINAKIFPYEASRIENYDESRSRKLLLHRKEIRNLKALLAQGKTTIIPLSLYTKGGLIKLQIALSKGKKQFEKKQDLKLKDLEREAQRELKKNF